jgi:hypothetical protein
VSQRNSRNKTIKLDLTIDIPGRVGNITDKTFNVEDKNITLTKKSLGIPAIFLLECKKVGVAFKEHSCK